MIVYRRCNRIPFSNSTEEELFKYVMLQKDKLLKNKQSLKSFNVWYSKSKNIYKIKGLHAMIKWNLFLECKDSSTFENQLIYHISSSKKKNHMNM